MGVSTRIVGQLKALARLAFSVALAFKLWNVPFSLFLIRLIIMLLMLMTIFWSWYTPK